MATKKLSEALAELQKAANVSGLDIRLVVAGQSSADNAQTITLQQLLTAINVPTVQTGAIGNNKQFIYSVSSDNPHAVMSGTFKAFQFNGKCHIRHKFWGSTNDYTDGQWTTCEIPTVNTSSNGVFEAAMLVRLRNTTLTEVNSTTDKVVVSYPNYANGSTKSLEITKATTAKAGVMTAEQVKQLQDLVNNPSSGAAQYLKWDSANHKYTYVATEAESDAVIPIASETKNGLMSKENAKSLSEIQSSYKDLGNFASEDAALAKIKSLEVCADSNIVHAHLTYANGSGKNTIILIQSIDNTMCRQIIFNKMKAFHRTITFTDANRTAIKTQEDWMFLFGDRLAWSPSQNKYVLSQFGNNYGWNYTDPIPTATITNDGLMSKSQATDLSNLKKTTKKKKTTGFAPCVHKAIPLMPKKGRRYFNRERLAYFDVKKDYIMKGYEFNYVENLVGYVKTIKVIRGCDGHYTIERDTNMQEYFSINMNNWDELFDDKVTKVQFEVQIAGQCIEIVSDGAIAFSDKFQFKIFEGLNNFRETASPLFVIEGDDVIYNASLHRYIYESSSKSLIAFYERANKKAKRYTGEVIKQSKRWRRVKKEKDTFLRLNKRSYKFRIYKARKKWNREFMSNVYSNVLRNSANDYIRKFIL